MDELSVAGQPLGFIANDFPILYKLPECMHWWKKRASAMRDRQTRIWSRHWATLKAQLKEGKAPPCFARSFLESAMKGGGIAEEEGMYLGGSELILDTHGLSAMHLSLLTCALLQLWLKLALEPRLLQS